MYADKYVSGVEDMPDVPHWAIIKTNGIHVTGDERSRTNPGHGYPAHVENFISYEVYLTEEKLLEAVKKLEEPRYGGNRVSYKVIQVTPAKIKVETKLVLEKPQLPGVSYVREDGRKF